MADPLNIYAIDDVAISTGFEIVPFISKASVIKKFINIYYSSEDINIAARRLAEEKNDAKNEVAADMQDIDEIKNAPVVKMIDSMFKNAVEMKVSDIHIEPFEDKVKIRYRIDGQLRLINSLGIESLAPLVTRIKILANLNIAEKRIPQDGRIITRVGDNEVDMRVSILPVVFGEKVVIRILDKKNYKVGKEHLVFSTLHTNDAPSSIVRLVDMGIQPYLVSTSIAGIIAQRLVRKICPKCRQAYEATSYEKQVLGVDEDKPLTLYKGKGCGYCNNTGYSGRTGVYEVMEVTRKLKEAITSHKTMDEIRDIAVQNGMSSLGDECKKLVLDGVTTMNELATITILKEI